MMSQTPKHYPWRRTVALLDRIYRLLLHAYPPAFRQLYGERMAQTFRDSCRDTLQQHGILGLVPLWGSLFYDLALNAFQERYPTWRAILFHLLPMPAALVFGLLIGYADLHAKEVQGAVLLILVLTFLFGILQPRQAWRWALLIGLGVPLVNWGCLLFGYHTAATALPFHLDTLIALIPACIGSYCGAGTRKLLQSVQKLVA